MRQSKCIQLQNNASGKTYNEVYNENHIIKLIYMEMHLWRYETPTGCLVMKATKAFAYCIG